jgi:nucleoside-diphosphate-sugar epimerase
VSSDKNVNILITGSTGFVGSRLVNTLSAGNGCSVTAATRQSKPAFSTEKAVQIQIAEIGPSTEWTKALRGQDVVIHVAAVAHMASNSDEVVARYQSVNVEGTLNLVRQSAEAGVKRFIFLSSIGVNGNISDLPYTLADEVNPQEAYAASKWYAEGSLKEVSGAEGMEFVIIRSPLVYGPSAPGNFGSLVRWIEKGFPLPLGSVHNKRSLVALDNLVDLIITCIDHPGAANETFLVSDGEDLSTTQLLQGVAEAMGKPSRLIPVPASLLQFGATLLGKKAVAQRLLGSLQVDISHTQKCLNWTPPLTVKQGLQRCFPNRQE